MNICIKTGNKQKQNFPNAFPLNTVPYQIYKLKGI